MATSLLNKFYNAIPTGLYAGFGIKLDYLPDVPVKCISLVLDTPGNSQKYFGQSDVIDRTTVVMTVRSETYQDGYDVAESIRDYFDRFYNNDFLGITSNGATTVLGKDNNGYRQFMVLFTIMVKE